MSPSEQARAGIIQAIRREPCPTCGQARVVVNGAWIRERRKAANLSLREVARRLHLSASYVSDLELNRRRCSKALWARILRALDVTGAVR